MNKTPIISIIVPVYNVEKYLKRCIDSILNQTFKDFELILVNDGSTDGCKEICNQYEKLDNRIKVIHKENGGLSSARNAGLDIAKGKYIGFVDSDDYINVNMYQNLLDKLIKNKSDLVICKLVRVKDNYKETINKSKIVEKNYDNLQALQELYNINSIDFIVAWNKLYKSELLKDIRYPVGKKYEDEFVIHKILNKCKKVTFINKELYYYYQRDDSIMGRRKVKFSPDILEAYEQMDQYFADAGEGDIVQLVKYRYMCLLKKYAVQMGKAGEQSLADKLRDTYKTEYKSSIRLVKKTKRKIRLWVYRWFKIDF